MVYESWGTAMNSGAGDMSCCYNLQLGFTVNNAVNSGEDAKEIYEGVVAATNVFFLILPLFCFVNLAIRQKTFLKVLLSFVLRNYWVFLVGRFNM